MSVPAGRYPTPFTITRAEHVELVVGDLDRSLRSPSR